MKEFFIKHGYMPFALGFTAIAGLLYLHAGMQNLNIWFYVLLVGAVGDFLTTYIFLKQSKMQEANKFLVKLFDLIGVPAALVLTQSCLVAVWYYGWINHALQAVVLAAFAGYKVSFPVWNIFVVKYLNKRG
jgi:hypothetical protein